MSNTPRATSLYQPRSSYQSQSEMNFYSNSAEKPEMNPQLIRSLSPEDVQKLKYKIELDKQVAEKQKRLAREWEKKLERDKKYVQHQPFGRNERTTFIKKEELEEILTRGRAPSPVLEMPPQYSIYHQQQQQQQPFMAETYLPNDNNSSNTYITPRQSMYDNQSQYPTYSNNNQSQPNNTNTNSNNNLPDFQRFYGPINNSNSNSGINANTSTAQPIKGDAHDPFLLYDPNKEGQNVFNAIPQQDLYDPWGRPGAGAPLIHGPTGQKFTRYSGSLQDKLNHVGPLGFFGKQHTENIEEQKRDLELEQRRRQQEEMELRSNAGDTAEWITQLERNRYPLKLHLPTTETTREITGARTRYRSEESRLLHDDLVRQAEERARINKMDRYNNSLAELQHTKAMNDWWGRGGGGAPSYNTRRHNVSSDLDGHRQKWTMNHLGQLTMADDQVPSQVKVQTTESYYPRNRQLSNHRNFYQMADDKAT